VPSTGQYVGGIATIGDEVFVVRQGMKHVDVYDAATMNVQRQLQLSTNATGDHYGLAACDVNKCVYVADNNGSCVHKVNIDGRTPATHWSVGSGLRGILLISDHNLLVACYALHKIREYKTDGSLVREIPLQSVTRPVNVAQLANDQYGVVHLGPYTGYSVVDVSGTAIKSYGDPSTAARQGYIKLSNPSGLAVSRRGSVFVSMYSGGCGNVVIDPSTMSAKQLTVDGSITDVFCVHIDHSRGRLYIGEWNGGRVVVIGKQ